MALYIQYKTPNSHIQCAEPTLGTLYRRYLSETTSTILYHNVPR